MVVQAAKLPKWDEVHSFLVLEKKLRTISPEEAQVRHTRRQTPHTPCCSTSTDVK